MPTFSRNRLHAFASNSDWLITLSVSVVIGQSNELLTICFHDTQLQTALLS